jgi:acyl carrier protein
MLEKYQLIFSSTFQVQINELNNLVYQGLPEWDSVGHMNLIAQIEETFDIMMDTDDIVDLSSYNKGIEILKKYGIEI